MSLPIVNGSAFPALAPPDYGRALALRAMAAAYTELPRYLLAPEVSGLLHHVPDWTQHALVNTLWNTGARLNEALALRRRDFRLNDAIPHVVIRTAKQRRTGSGRPKKVTSPNRVVPLSEPAYVGEMRRLFASVRLSIDVSPHTFRHSFAMHMHYHQVPPKVLQALMGNEKHESTEVYTKIFALDVAASQQVRLSMDTAGALQLLRAWPQNP